MSPIVHAFTGWLIGQNQTARRERVLVTAAAIVSDVDGIPILWGQEAYSDWHHTFGHSLLFGLLVTVAFGIYSKSLRCAALSFLAFHSHLLMDLLGSGIGWDIQYFWPFSKYAISFSPPFAWEFASWQNALVFFILLVWIGIVGTRQGRTVVEVVSTSADRHVVETLRRRFG